MPLFGRGVKARGLRNLVEKEVSRAKPEVVYDNGKSRVVKNPARRYAEREKWPSDMASVHEIIPKFPLLFIQDSSGRDLIEKRFVELKRPIIVLDWGCGNARAIEGFAKKYRKKICAYGYSKDSYSEWLKVKKAKLIQSTKEELFRYLKDGSVDVIYSSLGLGHIIPKEGSTAFLEYVEKLLTKVSNEGIIAFDLLPGIWPGFFERMEKKLGKKCLIIIQDGKVYLTKKKA